MAVEGSEYPMGAAPAYSHINSTSPSQVPSITVAQLQESEKLFHSKYKCITYFSGRKHSHQPNNVHVSQIYLLQPLNHHPSFQICHLRPLNHHPLELALYFPSLQQA